MPAHNAPLQESWRENRDAPLTPPELSVSGTAVGHFSLDWQAPDGHKSLTGDGRLPTAEVSLPEELELRLSRKEKSLTLTLMVFSGTIATVDPLSEPVLTLDCLSPSADCTLSAIDDSLIVRVAEHALPENGVISLFTEYYRGENVDTSTGFTNLASWAFGYRK